MLPKYAPFTVINHQQPSARPSRPSELLGTLSITESLGTPTLSETLETYAPSESSRSSATLQTLALPEPSEPSGTTATASLYRQKIYSIFPGYYSSQD